jgi:zinc transport system substrate-binding protein
MKNKFLVIGIAVIALIGVFFAANRLKPDDDASKQVLVVGSFYPLAHFAEKVGGEAVRVVTITPPGAEPHDFEPTPRDIVTVRQSKLFLYNGGGLDPWAEKLESDLSTHGTTVIHMSNAVDLLNATDPHFWLDPVIAEKEVAAIAEALIKIDPTHAQQYADNADQYRSQLKRLDQQYSNSLARCQKRDIITSHAAFGYLAKRYSIDVQTIAGLSPEEEPSARQLADLAHLARDRQIDYIFFETLASPKLAETLAKEVGAKTLVFNPIEGLTKDQLNKGQDYISVMQDNLQNLRTALACL